VGAWLQARCSVLCKTELVAAEVQHDGTHCNVSLRHSVYTLTPQCVVNVAVTSTLHRQTRCSCSARTCAPPDSFGFWHADAQLHGIRVCACSCATLYVTFVIHTKREATDIVGRRVAWKDPAGQWNVFLDVCPHRLVPLSEGRVNEDGRLVSRSPGPGRPSWCRLHRYPPLLCQGAPLLTGLHNPVQECPYHGWAFSAGGKCEVIPQGGNPAAPRSAATAYPCTIKQGAAGLPIEEVVW
jgi:nitrite reductase/ring-hydroxylating ferredoxin subunit